MIRITQLKLPADHSERELISAISAKSMGAHLINYKITRRSIDARKKPDIYYVYTIDASFDNERKLLYPKSPWSEIHDVRYSFPYTVKDVNKKDMVLAPVIAGSGPAGLFAGLLLARAGLCPIIFERGERVEERTVRVEAFFNGAGLDPESNVQFGEGGAGTFSDGKLNTAVKDKYGRNHFVLEEFVKHGAPEEILYDAKPHIGTDLLKNVVASIRDEIISLGGKVYFNTKVTDIIKDDSGRLIGVKTITTRNDTNIVSEENSKPTKELYDHKALFEEDGNHCSGSESTCVDASLMIGEGQESKTCSGSKNTCIDALPVGIELSWPADAFIPAIGHSARDTFYMLYEKGLLMKPKAFAMGVRVEHPASMINISQYGEDYPDILPTADYKLTHQCKNGRGVYSFCMCPGGHVVNSSSEKGRLCINGMSYHGRNGDNSNSAIITTVTPEDFESDHPLAGIRLQQKYEELCYKCCDGAIPVQLYADLVAGKKSSGFGTFVPSMKGKYAFANLRECLPDYIVEALLEGMKEFGKKIEGYDRDDAIISAIESRTSSPVRIQRDENCHGSIKGIFPCGEGAGYAGGITSAAMDGIKVAEQVAKLLLEE